MDIDVLKRTYHDEFIQVDTYLFHNSISFPIFLLLKRSKTT